MSHPLITRLAIRNFRSIAGCEVLLGPLTFLVGPNGSGKSNFLDALRFVADSLRHSMDHALRDRGGINEVRRRSSGHPTNFGIRIEFSLTESRGHLAFEVAAKPDGRYEIKREECTVIAIDGREHYYRVKNGVAHSTMRRPPAAAAGQLYLVRASGDSTFLPVQEALAQMGFYNLNPDAMRRSQPPAPERLLQRDGRNIASILLQLGIRAPGNKKKIEEDLGSVVKGIVGVNPKRFGPEEGLEFLQDTDGARHPWRFHSVGMSDGTLRALGVLTALFQSAGDPESGRLIGIEEPESALHPLAAGVLMDSLRDASRRVQVLATSHGTDLLDDKDITADELLAVVAQGGRSSIGRLDEAGRTTLRDRLCAPGELLRLGQVRPDPKIFVPASRQVKLFDRTPSTKSARTCDG